MVDVIEIKLEKLSPLGNDELRLMRCRGWDVMRSRNLCILSRPFAWRTGTSLRKGRARCNAHFFMTEIMHAMVGATSSLRAGLAKHTYSIPCDSY